ncbi:MAG: IclR family transcriptional regulator [Burkholderiaceae bacterium]
MKTRSPRHSPLPDAVDADQEARHDPNLGPRSPTRTLRILEIIAESPDGVSLAQLSQRLAIPKTSLFSLLRPLAAQGYLLQLGSRYILGPATVRLSIRASHNSSFLRAMHPTLVSLASQINETTGFVMLDETAMQTEYMDAVQSTKAVRYVVNPGERRPLYCTAAGLAVLAWQSSDEARRYLDSVDLQPVTPATVVDRAAILARLQTIREDGYVVTEGEYSDEVWGFASPVFCRPGQAIGAMTVGAPVSRARQARNTYAAAVMLAARRASAELVGDAADAAASEGDRAHAAE